MYSQVTHAKRTSHTHVIRIRTYGGAHVFIHVHTIYTHAVHIWAHVLRYSQMYVRMYTQYTHILIQHIYVQRSPLKTDLKGPLFNIHLKRVNRTQIHTDLYLHTRNILCTYVLREISYKLSENTPKFVDIPGIPDPYKLCPVGVLYM